MKRGPLLKFNSFEKICCLMLCLLLLLSMGWAVGAEEAKLLKGKTVNINKGTLGQLIQVPLITEKTAIDIIEYREENGDFVVLEELLQVEGFTPKLLERIKPFLLLEGIGGEDCTC